MRLTPPLNLPAPGRRQALYIVFVTSQSPVFLVNSRLGHFTATPSSLKREFSHSSGAPLFPKLRGYFAEFLSEGSLTRLRILSLSTCAGLRYGHPDRSPRGFSWQCGVSKLVWPKPHFPAFLGVNDLPDLPGRSSYDRGRGQPTPRMPILLRHPSDQNFQGGAGMLTCCPSPTPFGLGLGSD